MAHNRYHNPLDPWYVDEDVAETRHRQGGKAFGEKLQESTDRLAAEARKAAAARLRGGNAGLQSVEALERNIASRRSMSPGDLAQAAGPAAGGLPSVIPQSEPPQQGEQGKITAEDIRRGLDTSGLNPRHVEGIHIVLDQLASGELTGGDTDRLLRGFQDQINASFAKTPGGPMEASEDEKRWWQKYK